MKLLSKYNRVNVVATIIVLLLSGICYYFFIRAALIHQLDKDLTVEEREIKDFVKENNLLPAPYDYKDEQEEFSPAGSVKINRIFSSVDIFSQAHHEDIAYRQLEFPIVADGKDYIVVVRKSQEEAEDLIQLIFTITLVMVLILLASLFLINRFLLSKLWKPFNSTLTQIKQFNLSGKSKMQLEKSDIDEFKE